MVYKSLNIIQDWFFPGCCELCCARVDNAGSLCLDCERSLTRPRFPCLICADELESDIGVQVCGRCQQQTPVYRRASAALQYDDYSSSLIQGLKYNNRLHLAPTLGNILARHIIKTRLELPDVLMPIPLHNSRLRSRGFNQSYELAKPVARQLGLPVDPWRLQRVRKTPSQTDLPRKQRARNVHGAFAVNGGVQGLRIVLIDDVMTTGNTANEAAGTLIRAGAGAVDIWLVARA